MLHVLEMLIPIARVFVGADAEGISIIEQLRYIDTYPAL